MSQKIADKLLIALRHLGVPNEFASKIADSVDFMGESNEESAERDNYEIVIIAKALKSLLKRHSFPMESDELFVEAYTETDNINLGDDRNSDTNDDITKELPHTADYPETEKSLENCKNRECEVSSHTHSLHTHQPHKYKIFAVSIWHLLITFVFHIFLTYPLK